MARDARAGHFARLKWQIFSKATAPSERNVCIGARLFARQGSYRTSGLEMANGAEAVKITRFRRFKSKEYLLRAASRSVLGGFKMGSTLFNSLVEASRTVVLIRDLAGMLVEKVNLEPDLQKKIAGALLEPGGGTPDRLVRIVQHRFLSSPRAS